MQTQSFNFDITRALKTVNEKKLTHKTTRDQARTKIGEVLQRYGKIHTFDDPDQPMAVSFAIQGPQKSLNLSIGFDIFMQAEASDQHLDAVCAELNEFLRSHFIVIK